MLGNWEIVTSINMELSSVLHNMNSNVFASKVGLVIFNWDKGKTEEAIC
jgi:hypothetical protein